MPLTRLITSRIDPNGLERYRVQALIELLEAAVKSGVPITADMDARYEELQWALWQLDAYIEDESRTTHKKMYIKTDNQRPSTDGVMFEMYDDLEHDSVREWALIEGEDADG